MALVAIQQQGDLGEREAERWWAERGIDFLKLNWRNPYVEIDYAVLLGNTPVLFDVKAPDGKNFWKRQQSCTVNMHQLDAYKERDVHLMVTYPYGPEEAGTYVGRCREFERLVGPFDGNRGIPYWVVPKKYLTPAEDFAWLP